MSSGVKSQTKVLIKSQGWTLIKSRKNQSRGEIKVIENESKVKIVYNEVIWQRYMLEDSDGRCHCFLDDGLRCEKSSKDSLNMLYCKEHACGVMGCYAIISNKSIGLARCDKHLLNM
jgi:hypothetical protein